MSTPARPTPSSPARAAPATPARASPGSPARAAPGSPARAPRSVAPPGAPRKERAAGARPRKPTAARRDLLRDTARHGTALRGDADPEADRRRSKADLLSQVMDLARRLDADYDFEQMMLEITDERGRALHFTLGGDVRSAGSDDDL